MQTTTRRSFLGAAVTTATTVAFAPHVIARRPDDEVRLAVIGLKGRGTQLLVGFEKLPGVRVVGLCDVDEQVLARELEPRKTRGVVGVTDMRRLFERDDVDAVVIATPNHWHALATIWAVQAGKDVYVEKPVSWSITEGRRMIEAATQHERIVAAGFQNRSDTGLRLFMASLHAGELGSIRSIRGICYRRRDGIGPRLETAFTPPAHVDLDLWTGPADATPITRSRLHYDWHWVWNTGNGDFGNQGPHELDLMRWALGDPVLPSGVTTFAGRFGWRDAGETPNMHAATFHGTPVPMHFEVRDPALGPRGDAAKRGATYHGMNVGVVITCEDGEYRGGRGGGAIFDPDGKEVRRYEGDGGATHVANFIDVVRSRKASDLRSPLDQAHRSTALAHLANVAHRTGQTLAPAELAEVHAQDPVMTEMLARFTDHVGAWGVDLERERWTAGGNLVFDPVTERYVAGEDQEAGNALLTRAYRDGFRVPERV